jgi:hypothetical protein
MFAAVAALTMFTLSGCSGEGEGRPSVDDLSDALSRNDSLFGPSMPGGAVECVAKLFHDSDLSDNALRAILDEDADYDETDEDSDALRRITGHQGFAECVAAQ